MINKTNRRLTTINSDTTNYIGRIFPFCYILQGVAIHDREILHVKTFHLIDISYHLVVSLLQRVLLGIRHAALQSLIDSRSNGALVWCQQTVAAATCQSVVIAYDRTFHNLNAQLQLTHHGLHHGNLLPVFLTEIGPVRTYDIEQTAHHLANTIEMAWTMSALHHR